jgi:16S rRNA (cytosine1402-N4)-methyltransferase
MEWQPHQPVMLTETIDALINNPSGVYLDCTAGGGSHCAEILSRLSENGKLIALDRDGEAIEIIEKRFETDDRVVVVRGDFRDIGMIDEIRDLSPISGVLIDFGVSSHQIDASYRGFSFSKDGPLDMRMDKRNPLDAATVINTYELNELKRIIKVYGDEPQAGKIAAAIVEGRPYTNTSSFADIVRSVVVFNKQVKALARVFQAIRIEVNGELEAIEEVLPSSVDLLGKGGRLVTLAYHSLEDRLVKRFIRKMAGENLDDPYSLTPLDSKIEAVLKIVVRKALKPSEEEVERNPRARSARMRIAEKIV